MLIPLVSVYTMIEGREQLFLLILLESTESRAIDHHDI